MKISVRFALMLSAIGFVASSLQAWLSVRSAEEELRAAQERDLTVLARSLQVGFENALRDRQLEDVQETMVRVQAIAPEVDIAVFDAGQRLRASSNPAGLSDEVRAQFSTLPQPPLRESLRWLTLTDTPTLLAVLPLRTDSREALGTMVVVEAVPDFRLALSETREAALWSVVVFVLGIGATSLALGRLSITAPLEQLIGAMRRARLRSLDERISHQRRDEIGELAHEYNAMMDRLVATRSALERQQTRRHELEQQLARLDKLATVGQLAAALAHEIGSPLQVLVGRARALAEREHPSDKVRHHAQRIAEQGARITGIVEKLLGYARRRPHARRPVDLGEAAEVVVDLLEHEASRRAVELSLDRGLRPATVLADQDQLQQAILNLVRNALDANPDGGRVEISVTAPAGVGGVGERRWIAVHVDDHGVGIPAENLARLTEPFFTTRAHEGGTGLGLSVVKSIVSSHQGELEFESAAGRTRVSLRLPAHERLANEDP